MGLGPRQPNNQSAPPRDITNTMPTLRPEMANNIKSMCETEGEKSHSPDLANNIQSMWQIAELLTTQLQGDVQQEGPWREEHQNPSGF